MKIHNLKFGGKIYDYDEEMELIFCLFTMQKKEVKNRCLILYEIFKQEL